MAVWAAKCECCGREFLFFCHLGRLELEGHEFKTAKLAVHTQQSDFRRALETAYHIGRAAGIAIYNFPVGTGIGVSDSSRSGLFRAGEVRSIYRSAEADLRSSTPRGPEGISSAGHSILQQRGHEGRRPVDVWYSGQRRPREEDGPPPVERVNRRRTIDRETMARVVRTHATLFPGSPGIQDLTTTDTEMEDTGDNTVRGTGNGQV